MTDKKIFNILYISTIIAFLSFVLSIVVGIEILFTISAILIILLVIIMLLLFIHVSKIVEKKVSDLSEEVDMLLKQYNYDGVITYLKDTKNSTFYYNVINNCNLNLLLVYLIKDDIGKASILIDSIHVKEFVKNTYYYRMLICLDNDDFDSAITAQKALYRLDDSLFEEQKANSIKLLSIMNSGKQEKHQIINSNFPVVKRIVDKLLK